jgi:hypothetical protein
MNENDEKIRAEEAELELKELTRVWNPSEADIIQNFLESQGITCILRGQTPRSVSVYVFTTDGMGEIRIFVPAKDLETARNLLDEKSLENKENP